ncbi:HpcH/HpaI aldolase/citrate lyase family protein [Croceicoccus mobilis]|uniref:Citryl-CoA lyase n=1 Tax=Croceicoccus mobilis TaxID=1703339 RepID=A0A916YTW8_9SPHN|nr:CoA ester lyase [Croceicoccus mobilis]GGD60912.1 citryl-CoA lyase [Croceicoccus mobilis]
MADRQSVAARIAAARHFLFVPGNRPERFDKAVSSGADVAIFDLEDAVPPDAKDEARGHVRAWLDASTPAENGSAMLRINPPGTPWFAQDLELANHPNLAGVMLPKAAAGSVLCECAAIAPIVALLETAEGIATMHEVAATDGVERLAFGTIDLALDIDMAASDRQLDPLRLQLAIASRAAGIAPPIDGVTPDFRNPEANEEAMRAARTMGFRAKMVIHPAQLAPVEAALRPSEEEITRARRIVEADKAAGGSAVALDGAMVDRPIVERAYRLLADAER